VPNFDNEAIEYFVHQNFLYNMEDAFSKHPSEHAIAFMQSQLKEVRIDITKLKEQLKIARAFKVRLERRLARLDHLEP
jgi:hypothetical protein